MHNVEKSSNILSLLKKCPYLELLWSAFFHIWTEYREILRISPYSVRMLENADQNNSEYGHFSRNILRILFGRFQHYAWKSKVILK